MCVYACIQIYARPVFTPMATKQTAHNLHTRFECWDYRKRNIMCELKRNLRRNRVNEKIYQKNRMKKNQIECIVLYLIQHIVCMHAHHSYIVRVFSGAFFSQLFGILYFIQKMNKKNCIKLFHFIVRFVGVAVTVRCCWFAIWCLVMRSFFFSSSLSFVFPVCMCCRNWEQRKIAWN